MSESIEEIWETFSHSTNENVSLSRIKHNQYELIVQNESVNEACSIRLDRKHLKDLFNALGVELNAFWEKQ